MDINSLLNPLPQASQAQTIPPSTPKRPYARETTRSDRIRIKTALDWSTPRSVFRRYKDIYGYTLRQILYTRNQPITPQKTRRVGCKPIIPPEKVAQLKT